MINRPRRMSDWKSEINKILGIKNIPSIPYEEQIKKLKEELEKEKQLRLFYMRMAEEEKHQKIQIMKQCGIVGDYNG